MISICIITVIKDIYYNVWVKHSLFVWVFLGLGFVSQFSVIVSTSYSGFLSLTLNFPIHTFLFNFHIISFSMKEPKVQ